MIIVDKLNKQGTFFNIYDCKSMENKHVFYVEMYQNSCSCAKKKDTRYFFSILKETETILIVFMWTNLCSSNVK